MLHKTLAVVVVVPEREDVAVAAALCSIWGDGHRWRSHNDGSNVVLILRVAVAPHVRSYFVEQRRLCTWQCHESSSTRSSWITHVGAPDSLWDLEQELESALEGTANALLQYDDGGRSDMIWFPTASSASLAVLGQILQWNSKNNENGTTNGLNSRSDGGLSPLVLACLGNPRNLELQCRLAWNRAARSLRPVAVMGFPQPAWSARMVVPSGERPPDSSLNNHQRRVLLMFPNEKWHHPRQYALVTILGDRQQVSQPKQQLQVLRCLESTRLFPPGITLTVLQEPAWIVPLTMDGDKYNIDLARWIWRSLVYDPTTIAIPCCFYFFSMSDAVAPNHLYLGNLVLQVLEEVLRLMHHCCPSTTGKDTPVLIHNHGGCSTLLDVLLGPHGGLWADATQNQWSDIAYRLWGDATELCRNRWWLEILITRHWSLFWKRTTAASPWMERTKEDTTPDDGLMMRQWIRDSVSHGLELALGIGELWDGFDVAKRMPVTRHICHQLRKSLVKNAATAVKSTSAAPQALGIHTRQDLQRLFCDNVSASPDSINTSKEPTAAAPLSGNGSSIQSVPRSRL